MVEDSDGGGGGRTVSSRLAEERDAVFVWNQGE